MLIYINVENAEDWKFRLRPKYLCIPVFTVGMCVFYMRWGDFVGNIIVATLMTGLIWHAVYGLQTVRGQEDKGKNRRMLYIVTLVFCAAEYGIWTSSCFWMGDTIMNIYFWFDFLLSITFMLFLPALRKAVSR